jgi:hypothetical protein
MQIGAAITLPKLETGAVFYDAKANNLGREIPTGWFLGKFIRNY